MSRQEKGEAMNELAAKGGGGNARGRKGERKRKRRGEERKKRFGEEGVGKEREIERVRGEERKRRGREEVRREEKG